MPERSSLPSGNVQQVATGLWFVGWGSFWVQAALGTVSSLTLAFAVLALNGQTNASNIERGAGVSFAFGGLIALYLGIFWAFRYTRIAQQLRGGSAGGRPKKAETLKLLQIGIIINLVGMLLIIVASEAVVGALFLKTASQSQGVILTEQSNIVNSIDILVVLATTNAIAAHYAGLATSLWLLWRTTR